MKIKPEVGSKQRLFEMMNRVNKIKLNEEVNTDQAVISAFDQLKNGALEKVNGGNNETTVQSNDNITNVMIKGVDNQKNQYDFQFAISYDEGGEDGTYNINGTELVHFTFKKPDGSMAYDMDKNSLQSFNRQYSSEMFDVVDKYFEVEDTTPAPEPVEENEIKSVMDKSYPFGSPKTDIQKSKNYGDTEPVNPALRVKSKELDKFVESEDKSSSGAASSIFKNMMKGSHDDGTKKKRKTPEKKVDEEVTPNGGQNSGGAATNILKKSIEQPNKSNGENTRDYEKYPKSHGEKMQDYGNFPTKASNVLVPPEKKSSNKDLAEAARAAIAKVKGENTDEAYDYAAQETGYADMDGYKKYQEYQEMDFDNLNDQQKEEFFELWKEFKGAVKNVMPPVGVNEEETETGNDELEGAVEKRSEMGDQIQGGLADDDQPDEYNVEQLLMGLEIELEHTDDPMVALEIAMDHLAEIPDYYTRLKTMEAEAKQNGAGSTDPSNPSGCINAKMGDEDSELTDELLGYKPHNVGDYSNMEEK